MEVQPRSDADVLGCFTPLGNTAWHSGNKLKKFREDWRLLCTEVAPKMKSRPYVAAVLSAVNHGDPTCLSCQAYYQVRLRKRHQKHLMVIEDIPSGRSAWQPQLKKKHPYDIRPEGAKVVSQNHCLTLLESCPSTLDYSGHAVFWQILSRMLSMTQWSIRQS